MQIDSYFEKSTKHSTCQDYAISNDSCIIICDGCSTSPFSEIGSRITSFLVLNELENIKQKEIGMFLYDLQSFHKATFILLQKIMACKSSLFDCTILLCFKKNNNIDIVIYGDGNIITKNKKGDIDITTISYNNNMPYYLSYNIDEERKKEYSRCHPVITICKNNKIVYEHNNWSQPYIATHDINDYHFVGISSDGLNNIHDKTGNKIDVMEIVTPLLDFKTSKGKFMTRRCRSQLREFRQKGYIITDDISIGGFII